MIKDDLPKFFVTEVMANALFVISQIREIEVACTFRCDSIKGHYVCVVVMFNNYELASCPTSAGCNLCHWLCKIMNRMHVTNRRTTSRFLAVVEGALIYVMQCFVCIGAIICVIQPCEYTDIMSVKNI